MDREPEKPKRTCAFQIFGVTKEFKGILRVRKKIIGYTTLCALTQYRCNKKLCPLWYRGA